MKANVQIAIALILTLLCHPLTAVFNDESPCFKDLQTNFFRADIVMEALSLQGVVQNQWVLITQKLNESSRNVPQLLKHKADALELAGQVNPLLYPFQPEGADRLLNGILMQIFINVLRESNVTDENMIREMYAYIRNKQSDRLKACYGEEVKLQ